VRRLGLAAVLVLTGVVITACIPTEPGYKPLLAGIVNKGSETYFHLGEPYPVIDLSEVAASSPGLTGTVVDVSWSQLEPSEGTFDFSTLDADLTAVSAYNTAHPGATLGVKLRVWGANDAPGWAKTMDGTSITTDVNNMTATVGQWWKPDYRAAWAALQVALAQRYDNNPLINEVVVASCASLTDEPMVMAASPDVASVLLADGWSDSAQQACLDGALSDYAPWQHTAIYYPFNPFTTISSSGQRGIDDSVTAEVMQRCADSLSSGGPWCILGNNALDSSQGGTFVYSEINSLYAANPSNTVVAFQMNSPADVGTAPCQAVAVAVSEHASSIEFWPQTGANLGFTGYSPATLQGWGNDLVLGAAPTCT
jgi:Beta-galactosidase